MEIRYLKIKEYSKLTKIKIKNKKNFSNMKTKIK